MDFFKQPSFFKGIGKSFGINKLRLSAYIGTPRGEVC